MTSRRLKDKKVARKLVARFSVRPGRWVKRVCGIAAGDSGSELLEFAFVVPMLLMLLIGIFWIGRAFNIYENITRAAREGARYAVLPSSVAMGNAYADLPTAACASNTIAFTNYVAPALVSDHLDPSLVQGYCQKAQLLENTFPQQCGVVVKFSYPFTLAIPFTSMNATTINIPTQAQMRLENQGGNCP